jgi:hypothetical protein
MPTDTYQAEAPLVTSSASDTNGGTLRVADPGPAEVDLDTTLSHPGSVRINVKGAFIVDQGTTTPASSNGRGSPNHHETKDIRLPNHTAVVSHIAIDVCDPSSHVPCFPRSHPNGWDAGLLVPVRRRTLGLLVMMSCIRDPMHS